MNGMPIARNLVLAAAFAVLVTLPFWMPGTYYINVSSQVLFYAIFALGLNILVGYGGLVSLRPPGRVGIPPHPTPYLLSKERCPTTPILRSLLATPRPTPRCPA